MRVDEILPPNRSDINRSNRARGHKAERDLARYLRGHGWPDAERLVSAAIRTRDRTRDDCGDIAGTPGVVWQVKHHTRDLVGAALVDALHATTAQTVAGGADYGVLVQRRDGKADPGQWWAHLSLDDLTTLALRDTARIPEDRPLVPTRLALCHAVALLHAAGYGEPPDPPTPQRTP
jgi:hypothetical protein